MKRLTIFALPVLAAIVFSGPAFAEQDPRAVGEAFCSARLADDEAATLALLTPSLVKEIEEAKARSDVIAKSTPDQKPPLGDGIPYQAFPDAVGTCAVGEAVEKPGRIELEIVYQFPGSPDAGWTDRLKLVADGERLAIDDVLYANVANGDPDLGLREVLFGAFDQ